MIRHEVSCDVQLASRFDESDQMEDPLRLLNWLPDPLTIQLTNSSFYPLPESQWDWMWVAGDWNCARLQENAMLEPRA